MNETLCKDCFANAHKLLYVLYFVARKFPRAHTALMDDIPCIKIFRVSAIHLALASKACSSIRLHTTRRTGITWDSMQVFE